MPDFVIKKGDLRPILSDTLTYSDGTTVNLTGGSVKFVMRSVTATAPTTNATATIVNATAPCQVSYTFTATDTATAGAYQAEWHVTFADTSTMTFPTDGYLEIVIEEDLITPSPVGRLVDLGLVKDHLNIPANDRTHDAELVRFIDATTPVVENITGDIIQRQRHETYDGGYAMISLRHRPVVSVESVIEYRGPIAWILQQVANPALGSIYSYTFEGAGRIVRRTVGGGSTTFPVGMNAVEVQYTSGYATVPANVKLGALELIRVNYQQTQQGARGQFGVVPTDQFDGIQMLGFFVPNRVRELLSPSRRHPSIA